MVIYVRVVDDVGSSAGTPPQTTSPRRPRLGPAFEMMPANGEQALSRPPSRMMRKRSASPPSLRGHRSVSAGTNKSRQRMGLKSRVGSTHGEATGDCDSDSDGGNASVTSSRRGKIDVVASAEISVDNIVEGGRRKRARFDSSVSVLSTCHASFSKAFADWRCRSYLSLSHHKSLFPSPCHPSPHSAESGLPTMPRPSSIRTSKLSRILLLCRLLRVTITRMCRSRPTCNIQQRVTTDLAHEEGTMGTCRVASLSVGYLEALSLLQTQQLEALYQTRMLRYS
jgi:hypothetical protein